MKQRSVKPYNAMTKEEKTAVQEIVADEKHADESTRGLSVRLMEERGLYVSHVSIWEYERSIEVNGHRGFRRNQTSRPEKPDTDFAAGPNQLWSWDITKLRTEIAYVFFIWWRFWIPGAARPWDGWLEGVRPVSW